MTSHTSSQCSHPEWQSMAPQDTHCTWSYGRVWKERAASSFLVLQLVHWTFVYYIVENRGCPRMSPHILNIFIEEINRVRRVWFSSHDSRNSKFYVWYLFCRVQTTVRMLKFQGIWIQNGQRESNKGSSGHSAMRWRKGRIAISYGENYTLLTN